MKKGKQITSEEPEIKKFTPKINTGWGHEKHDKKGKKKIPENSGQLMAQRKRDRDDPKNKDSLSG